MKIKTLFLSVPALMAAALFSGCYTQFVMVDRTPPPPKEQVSYQVDSATGDTVKVIKQIDTVQTRDRQTCIWQRDLMGYPRLYCYDSNYPSNWLYYNYSPWWYDEYPYYSGGYYYGGRRHYTHSYYERDNDRGGSSPSSTHEPAGASGSAYRARVRGVPGPDAEPIPGRSSSTVTTSGEKNASVQTNEPSRGQIIIPSSAESAPRITRERSAGVSATGSAVPQQPPPPSTSASSPPPAPPPPQVQNSGSSSTPPPPTNNGGSGNHRRNPRSW